MKQTLPRSSQKRSSLPWTTMAVVIVTAMAPVSRLSPAAVAAQRRGDAAPAKTAPPAAPAATFQDKFITTSEGRKVHYVDWGNAVKRPFIMLHGINRTGHVFDKVAPFLYQDYHVIAMTLRGHGDSDWSPKHEYMAEDHARDLHSLIEQLNLRDVVLNGNSMGGRVVQVYAGQHPERVWKVVVDDVGPERPESVTRTLTSRIGQETDGWASEEELLKSLQGNRTRTPEQAADLRERIRYESKKLPNGRVGWKYDPDITAGLGPIELWPYVRKFKSPVLYIVGANSNLLPKETQAQLKATLPNIEVVTIPDAGHTPHQDNPQVWLAVVKAFLAG
jgi:pimeloyl-ACP methyl ester carboxylesterase